jgi:hypothetical protein
MSAVRAFLTMHPSVLFRRDRRFYLAYDLSYAGLSVALGAAMALSRVHLLLGAPRPGWVLVFPLAVYAVVVAHLSIHNAVHGSFPKPVNRLIGEVLGLVVVVRFASWVMVHLRHHRHSDDRRSDPHANFASFWETAKHTVVQVEKQLMQEYYDRCSARRTPTSRSAGRCTSTSRTPGTARSGSCSSSRAASPTRSATRATATSSGAGRSWTISGDTRSAWRATSGRRRSPIASASP